MKRRIFRSLSILGVILLPEFAIAQLDRIPYNGQQLFLSGANLAWVSFANDIGPAQTDTATFADIFLQMHDHGGNAARWWLHTNGTTTPEFSLSDTGLVVGPGTGTIADLRKILDLAWEREVGLVLCLWSFDMMRSSNSALVKARNRKLLTDTSYARAYIQNCLVPMVDSLKGHPGIIGWEIFNEPEGMSNEYGFNGIVDMADRIPMSAVQQFVNLCAGAIHRTDTTALVTNGTWSIVALTDVATQALGKTASDQIPKAEQIRMTDWYNHKYRSALSVEDVMSNLALAGSLAGVNYYKDSLLIAAGGDPDGTLDFFSVHFYGTNTAQSPFNHGASTWNLDKPIVVAEFALQDAAGFPPKEYFYSSLLSGGYAGALAWSWTDVNLSSHEDMLASMKFLWDNSRSQVDVDGISGDWPLVEITSPKTDSVFASLTEITIVAKAWDPDGSSVTVGFFANDTLELGELATDPDSLYRINWTPPGPGFYELTARATDDSGHQRISNRVDIQVGTPTMTRLEAELAPRSGSGMTVRNSTEASGDAFLDMATQSGSVTWTLPNVPAAGSYLIAFAYRLFYDTPKSQYVSVNGATIGEYVFEGSQSEWLEQNLSVNLNQGGNTIQMLLSWGWMYLDYLAVPTEIVSSAEPPGSIPVAFTLEQNYPNPFNPSTEIRYSLPGTEHVLLVVYDVLGRQVATLVDEKQAPGIHRIQFQADHLTSGMYIYRIKAGGFAQSMKMIVVR